MQGFDPKFRDFPDYIIGITKEIWEDRGIATLHEYYAKDIIVRSPGSVVTGNLGVIAQSQIKKNLDRRSALHMGQQLKRKRRGDFLDNSVAQNDFLQELRFYTGGAGGAWEGVVDKEVQGVLTMLAARILDLRDQLGDKGAVINGLGVQTLFFTSFDLCQVVGVQAHDDPYGLVSE